VAFNLKTDGHEEGNSRFPPFCEGTYKRPTKF